MKKNNQLHEVDKIIDKRLFKNKKGQDVVQFRVKWKDYNEIYDQWVYETDIIEYGQERIEEYEESQYSKIIFNYLSPQQQNLKYVEVSLNQSKSDREEKSSINQINQLSQVSSNCSFLIKSQNSEYQKRQANESQKQKTKKVNKTKIANIVNDNHVQSGEEQKSDKYQKNQQNIVSNNAVNNENKNTEIVNQFNNLQLKAMANYQQEMNQQFQLNSLYQFSNFQNLMYDNKINLMFNSPNQMGMINQQQYPNEFSYPIQQQQFSNQMNQQSPKQLEQDQICFTLQQNPKNECIHQLILDKQQIQKMGIGVLGIDIPEKIINHYIQQEDMKSNGNINRTVLDTIKFEIEWKDRTMNSQKMSLLPSLYNYHQIEQNHPDLIVEYLITLQNQVNVNERSIQNENTMQRYYQCLEKIKEKLINYPDHYSIIKQTMSEYRTRSTLNPILVYESQCKWMENNLNIIDKQSAIQIQIGLQQMNGEMQRQ